MPVKLQDPLHYFLHALFRVARCKYSSENFDETFAMLDKSVYHIFGEDCARYASDTRIFLENSACSRRCTQCAVPCRSAKCAQTTRFYLHFAIFQVQSVNYLIAPMYHKDSFLRMYAFFRPCKNSKAFCALFYFFLFAIDPAQTIQTPNTLFCQ